MELKLVIRIVSLFILCVTSGVFAKVQENQPPHLMTLESAVLNEQRTISVYLPASFQKDTSRKFPVIYVLDGEGNGASVASLNDRMVLSGGANEHIVVAIHSTQRLHDFSPEVNRDPRGPVGVGGGADKFMLFLTSELMPKIEGNYPVSDFRVIAGHSIAGLFVIYSFHAYPEVFQGYLAFSPAMWWATRKTSIDAQEYMLSEGVVPAYLYINIGNESGEMRAVYDQFANAMLRSRPLDLEIRTETYRFANHGLTFPAGLYSALNGLFQYQNKKGLIKQ